MNVLDVQYVFAGLGNLDVHDVHEFVLQCIYGVNRKQGRRGDADSPATDGPPRFWLSELVRMLLVAYHVES